MKTYIFDYAKATFSSIHCVVAHGFPEAMVVCADINEDCFAGTIIGVNDLDALDDVLAPFLWED